MKRNILTLITILTLTTSNAQWKLAKKFWTVERVANDYGDIKAFSNPIAIIKGGKVFDPVLVFEISYKEDDQEQLIGHFRINNTMYHDTKEKIEISIIKDNDKSTLITFDGRNPWGRTVELDGIATETIYNMFKSGTNIFIKVGDKSVYKFSAIGFTASSNHMRKEINKVKNPF